MRSAFRIGLLLVGTALAAVIVSRAEAQKQHFLMINNPQDRDVYAPWTTCVVAGVLLLPESADDIKSSTLLVSLYAPHKHGFVIANQAFADVEKIAGEKSYFFKAPLELRVDEVGRYLLKVDCLGPKGKEKLHSLLATSSIFIEVKKAKGTGSKESQPKTRGETIRINNPQTGTRYDHGASFDAGGTSTQKDVARLRLRVLQGGTSYAENIVNEVKSAWQGTLRPPKGGWPAGEVTIEALGLDSNLLSVPKAIDSIGITSVPR